LTPSATYATTTAPQSPVARPAASAVPGIYPRALDPSQTSPRQQETVLAWEDLVKEVNLKPGETKAYFTFAFTNTTPNEVVVTAVRSSCGCTTAKVPTLPWKLPGGTNAAFDVVVDVRGKSGIVTKTVTIETSAGYRYLTTRVAIPAGATGSMATAERARNLQLALADRQSVLAGECATCHVTPGVGKQGAELYEAVCGVCHEAEHRASMVPNLRALGKPFKAEDWRKTIREGKKDSLMPAFATSEGGPLTDAQIESLVTYLAGAFKTLTPASHAKSLNRSAPVNRPQE
jgi:mono/diheme cytochrome c family protein